MKLTREETETHFNMTADDRSVWVVYTDDPVWQRRLEGMGFEPVSQERGGGKTYRLPARCVTVRKPYVMSEAQRESLNRARLAAQAQAGQAQNETESA